MTKFFLNSRNESSNRRKNLAVSTQLKQLQKEEPEKNSGFLFATA